MPLRCLIHLTVCLDLVSGQQKVFTPCLTAEDFACAANPHLTPPPTYASPTAPKPLLSPFQPLCLSSRQQHCNTSTACRSGQCPLSSRTSGSGLKYPQTVFPLALHMGDSLIRSWPRRRHQIPYFMFQGFSYGDGLTEPEQELQYMAL